MNPRFAIALVALIYVAASWLVYGWTLSAPFLLDDQQAIRNNPAIHSLALPEALNPPPTDMGFSRRPVANLTMAFNYALGDLRLEGYRAFNLLLHAFNALLLFLLVRFVAVRVTGLGARTAWWAAFFAGLIWVVHPLSTSAVHYLTQRPELLAACAFLAMFCAQARSLFSAHARKWLAAAWLACLVAMGSKESMALLPVLAVLFDRCATRWTWREQFRNRGIYYLLLLATLAWPVLLLINDDSGLALSPGLEERWLYFLTVAEGVVRHVSLIIWPSALVFDYGTKLVQGVGEVLWPLAAVVVAGFFVAWGLWQRSLAAWVGAAVFAVMLPSWINMAPGQPIAEHRFYLPSGLLIAVLCGSCGAFCARRAALKFPFALLAGIATVALAFFGKNRAALYADPAALIEADITAWPRSDRGHMNLGLVLEVQEDYARAARHYEAAMGRPDLANWRPVIALARLRMRAGDEAGAVALAADALRRVFSVEGAPDLEIAVNTLVSSFRSAGRLDAALPLLRAAEASAASPRFLRQTIRVVTAETLGLGSIDEEFREESENNPLDRINYAVALGREGKNSEALAQIDSLLSDAPPDSDPAKLAEVHALKGAMIMGDPTAATKSFETALRLNPSHVEALNNFAWLLATAEREEVYDPGRAVELARKAVRLRPDETNFRGTLAVALAANGEIVEAETATTEAQRLGRVNGNANPELPNLVRAAAERHASNRQSPEH